MYTVFLRHMESQHHKQPLLGALHVYIFYGWSTSLDQLCISHCSWHCIYNTDLFGAPCLIHWYSALSSEHSLKEVSAREFIEWLQNEENDDEDREGEGVGVVEEYEVTLQVRCRWREEWDRQPRQPLATVIK